MLKLKSVGVTARWDLLGDPAVTPAAVPAVTELPGAAGHWGSLGVAVLLWLVARELGGPQGAPSRVDG